MFSSLWALLAWGYYQAIYVAPNDAMQGEIYRIFYYHVPIAMDSSVFFIVSLAGRSAILPTGATVRNGRRLLTPGHFPALKSRLSTAPSSSPQGPSGDGAPGASGGPGMRA